MRIEYGEVKEFDTCTCIGQVLIEDKLHEFPSTCFYSGRPVRFPKVGDQVQVYFTEKGEILSVMIFKWRML